MATARSSRRAVSDEEYDADVDDDDDKEEEEEENKDGLGTADADEQRQFNAFICSKIDETWVSLIGGRPTPYHRRRSSVNFWGRYFCPKYMCEKLTNEFYRDS